MNAEYNQLATAFDNTAGHDHTGSVAGDGAKISLTASVTGVLPVANGGTGSSTSPPTLTALNINPGGVLVGTAGSVPGTGSLTLNANTVAPPTYQFAGQVVVVGANGSGPVTWLDAFGGGIPLIRGRSARGTAAAPTASLVNDTLMYVGGVGRGATGYSIHPPYITLTAAENFTDTAQGSQINLSTTALGSTTEVVGLILQGNAATFSVQLFLGGGLAPGGCLISGQGGSMGMQLGAPGGGSYIFYNNAGFSLQTTDTNGNLTIAGATATKASGTTWANPSSRDIKQDIKPYDKGLQAVLALNPVTYRFSDDSGFPTNETHIGLVHDETGHMPEMHRKATIGAGADKPGREVDALDCGAVTWALVRAIQELKAELDAVKAKVGA